VAGQSGRTGNATDCQPIQTITAVSPDNAVNGFVAGSSINISSSEWRVYEINVACLLSFSVCSFATNAFLLGVSSHLESVRYIVSPSTETPRFSPKSSFNFTKEGIRDSLGGRQVEHLRDDRVTSWDPSNVPPYHHVVQLELDTHTQVSPGLRCRARSTDRIVFEIGPSKPLSPRNLRGGLEATLLFCLGRGRGFFRQIRASCQRSRPYRRVSDPTRRRSPKSPCHAKTRPPGRLLAFQLRRVPHPVRVRGS